MKIEAISSNKKIQDDIFIKNDNISTAELAIAHILSKNLEKIQKLNIDPLSEALVKYGHNEFGIPALHYAIYKKDLEAVKIFIEHGADPNSIISGHWSLSPNHSGPIPENALDIAAAFGNREMIEFLVAKGAKINNVNRRMRLQEDTTLYFAAAYGNLETIEALLNLGANIDDVSLGGAALCGQIESVKFLLKRGFNPNSNLRSGILYLQPLNAAIYNGSIENRLDIIELLLSNGAKINYENIYTVLGGTGLINNRENILNLLIKYHADLNLKAPKNLNIYESPILLAACQITKDPKIVKLFLENGADPNAKDNKGVSVLDFYKNNNEFIEIKKLLLAYEAK